jgi:flagella basal body P-ring formation protein FlgA
MNTRALLLAGLVWAGLAAAAEVDIELKSSATVLRGEVRLGEIASVACKDPALAESARAIPLGAAPWPGNARLIGRDHVAACFERAGHDPAGLRWRGPVACTVLVRAARVTGDEIVRAGRDYLLSLPAFQRDDVRVECEQTPREHVFAAGEKPLTIEPSCASADKPWGRLRVFVKIGSDGRTLATVPVTYLVSSRQKAIIAARPIARGELLDLACIETREMLLGPQSDGDAWLTKPDDVAGKKALRAVAAGMPLTAAMLATPFAVRRGEDVSVALRSSHMEVLTKGVVQRDAFVGDLVPVKVFATGKELTCKVTSSGVVELPL